MKFPTLSFEEYRHATVHLTMRAELLADQNCPVLDHLLIKWYIREVLRTTAQQEQTNQHYRFYGALQTMIRNGVFEVVAATPPTNAADPTSLLRILKLHPQSWPIVFSSLEPRNK